MKEPPVRASILVVDDTVENLHLLSKIDAGRTTLVVAAFDLHALLDGLEQMFLPLVLAKGIDLVLERPPSLPRIVQGDAGRIRQVLINLLSNATKFTERGGISVWASATALSERSYLVTIVVRDTGSGIEPADLGRVFGVFEQSSVGIRAGGAGLGLAISRDLARLMGGDLTATSEPGTGTSFAFSFEARPAEGRRRQRLGWGRPRAGRAAAEDPRRGRSNRQLDDGGPTLEGHRHRDSLCLERRGGYRRS